MRHLKTHTGSKKVTDQAARLARSAHSVVHRTARRCARARGRSAWDHRHGARSPIRGQSYGQRRTDMGATSRTCRAMVGKFVVSLLPSAEVFSCDADDVSLDPDLFSMGQYTETS